VAGLVLGPLLRHTGEHWAAFGNSVRLLEDLLERVASGRHGRAPGSVVLLSGDVHHAYVAHADFADRPGARASTRSSARRCATRSTATSAAPSAWA